MLLVRMIKFYLPDLHSLSILVLKRTGFYDSQEVLDNAAKMENMRISERYWGGGGGNGKREGGSNTGRVRVNTMYAKFLGYRRKGFTSRDRYRKGIGEEEAATARERVVVIQGGFE